jgi:hypothetical protein
MGWDGIGTLIGKIANWIPQKREYYQNKIDEIKKEMLSVQKSKPFDACRYVKLADKLQELESKERRTS